MQSEAIEKVSKLVASSAKAPQTNAIGPQISAIQKPTTKGTSKLIALWVVKFYKAIIKAKDEAFVMYIIKKNLLKTIVDIYLDNVNKGNLLHSAILELFDYLTKEPNKKIANSFI